MEITKKKQIIFIHGAEKYATRDAMYRAIQEKEYNPYTHKKRWFDWVAWGLDAEYESFIPQMPNTYDADYTTWKIMFEKTFPFLNKEDLILIGGSMGAIFLLKYLSENSLPYKAKQVHLVSPAISDEGIESEEIIGDFKMDLSQLGNLVDQADEVFLYHSKDDEICPFSHSEEIAKQAPEILFHIFENRGHFEQSAFPELFANIPSEIF